MYKYFILCLLCLHIKVSFTQDYEDEFNKYAAQTKNQFGKFTDDITTDFKNYSEKIDQEFTEYLKESWEEFNVLAGMKLSLKPKPTTIPHYDKKYTQKGIVKEITSIKTIKKTDEPTAAIVNENPSDVPRNKLSINYYGEVINIEFDSRLSKINLTTINEEYISLFWGGLNATDYGFILTQLNNYRYTLNLNDWAYYLLIKKISEHIISNKNTSIALQWFLLNKSGYKAKIGYQENTAYLMIPTYNTIYETPFYIFSGINFYILNFDGTSINTYSLNYPEATNIISLDIYKPLSLPVKEASSLYEFSFLGQSYRFNLSYNQHIIDFYKDYPLTDLYVYFNAPITHTTLNSIHNNLSALIGGMDNNTSVEFLLSFAQEAFEYKVDTGHLNKEKFYFPEEILFYPYSDCEDRSVFFANLIRELLGLDVVGINFTDHVATAVHFDDTLSGKSIFYDNKKFTICDPTCLNAPPGAIIDDYLDVDASIIPINNTISIQQKKRDIWKSISLKGGWRGDNSTDIVFDKQGNYIITGLYDGQINLGSISLSPGEDKNGVFIAKFSGNDSVLWAKSIIGKDHIAAFSIAINNTGEIYILGMFERNAKFDDIEIESDKDRNFFLAKADNNGNPLWLKHIPIDTASTANYLLSKFTQEGEQVWLNYSNHAKRNTNFNILIESDNIAVSALIPYAINSSSLSTKQVSYAKYSEFDLAGRLTSEYVRLLQNDYNKSIAGLFAAINLVVKENIILTGQVIQQAVDKQNPIFKVENKPVYDNIGSIEEIKKSSKGNIILHTSEEKTITFNKIAISHKAEFLITNFSKGDARIDIYEGIKINNQSLANSEINYLNLLKEGIFLFNFGNSYKAQMRIKPDIVN